jgi:hypothetical protein
VQSANLDDASAPNIGGQFGRQGGNVQFDLPRESNTFGIRGSGTALGPPAYISQYWEEGQGNDGATTAQRGRAAAGPAQGTITPMAPVVPSKGVYSGMATAVTKWGIGDKITQTNKLHWQQGVGGDKTKIEQFCEVAGALQEFKTYLFIKPGSAFCTVIHSPMKFVAITDATQQLQGQIIGFVVDRTLTKEPTPILMPPRKAWDWVKVKVATDGPALIAYYEGKSSNRGTLWTPPVGSEETEATVPRLLHIPLVLFDKIRMAGRPLMPHKVLSMILEHVESIADKAPEVRQAWQLAMQ